MLGESGPVQLGSCLHPTPHPTPGFTIFSQWLVPVLFSYVFSRDIWSQEPGITRCGSCVPPNLQIFLVPFPLPQHAAGYSTPPRSHTPFSQCAGFPTAWDKTKPFSCRLKAASPGPSRPPNPQLQPLWLDATAGDFTDARGLRPSVLGPCGGATTTRVSTPAA